jgi:hypothetical protein
MGPRIISPFRQSSRSFLTGMRSRRLPLPLSFRSSVTQQSSTVVWHGSADGECRVNEAGERQVGCCALSTHVDTSATRSLGGNVISPKGTDSLTDTS